MNVVEYPDAARYIPATDAVLERGTLVFVAKRGPWPREDQLRHGSAAIYMYAAHAAGRLVVVHADAEHACSVHADDVFLDPAQASVRDHLIRRLDLPAWMRDTDGGLEVWRSAGLVACSATRVGAAKSPVGSIPQDWVDGAETIEGSSYRPPGWGDDVRTMTWVGSRGWNVGRIARGRETGAAGKAAADAALLAYGCALMLDADTLVLPYPDGPRVWRRR